MRNVPNHIPLPWNGDRKYIATLRGEPDAPRVFRDLTQETGVRNVPNQMRPLPRVARRARPRAARRPKAEDGIRGRVLRDRTRGREVTSIWAT